MIDTCFLGANTPEGFRSEYATLQSDPRIRRLLIIKGGSGCGKSTLMKTVGARAEEYGWAVERVLAMDHLEKLADKIVEQQKLDTMGEKELFELLRTKAGGDSLHLSEAIPAAEASLRAPQKQQDAPEAQNQAQNQIQNQPRRESRLQNPQPNLQPQGPGLNH